MTYEYICGKCGACVGNSKRHTRWHDQLNDRSEADPERASSGDSAGEVPQGQRCPHGLDLNEWTCETAHRPAADDAGHADPVAPRFPEVLCNSLQTAHDAHLWLANHSNTVGALGSTVVTYWCPGIPRSVDGPGHDRMESDGASRPSSSTSGAGDEGSRTGDRPGGRGVLEPGPSGRAVSREVEDHDGRSGSASEGDRAGGVEAGLASAPDVPQDTDTPGRLLDYYAVALERVLARLGMVDIAVVNPPDDLLSAAHKWLASAGSASSEHTQSLLTDAIELVLDEFGAWADKKDDLTPLQWRYGSVEIDALWKLNEAYRAHDKAVTE